jgi:hypothetical protein
MEHFNVKACILQRPHLLNNKRRCIGNFWCRPFARDYQDVQRVSCTATREIKGSGLPSIGGPDSPVQRFIGRAAHVPDACRRLVTEPPDEPLSIVARDELPMIRRTYTNAANRCR